MNSTTNYVVFHQNLHVKMVQMHKHDKNIYHIPLRDRPFKKNTLTYKKDNSSCMYIRLMFT